MWTASRREATSTNSPCLVFRLRRVESLTEHISMYRIFAAIESFLSPAHLSNSNPELCRTTCTIFDMRREQFELGAFSPRDRPLSAREILEGDDHQNTLVFASRLRNDRQIAFHFAWPTSLVGRDGSCRGVARLSLVATPRSIRGLVRSLCASTSTALCSRRISTRTASCTGGASRFHLPSRQGGSAGRRGRTYRTRAQVESGQGVRPHHAAGNRQVFELAPLRRVPYARRRAGAGNRRTLHRDPDYLRSREKRPVFADMRQSLRALGVHIEDIRTAARVATRI